MNLSVATSVLAEFAAGAVTVAALGAGVRQPVDQVAQWRWQPQQPQQPQQPDKGRQSSGKSYSMEEVSDHSDGQSCWLVINQRVYDVTRFLRNHPGGSDIMLEYGGRDASDVFVAKGHSDEAMVMLKDYYIGDLVERKTGGTAFQK